MVKKMKRKIDKKTTLLPAIFTKKVTTWLVTLLFISLIFTVIPVVKIAPASSVTWYVATTGSDTAAGDISHPFKTIQHAVDVAQAGDTIYIHAGTYNERITIKRSGTAGNPIILTGVTGEAQPIIDGTGYNHWQGLIYLNSQKYITFNNLKIQNSATHGIYTSFEPIPASTDITVTNCNFFHIARYSILFYAEDKTNPCYRMKVTHCNFDDIQYAVTTEECATFGGCYDSEFSYNTMTNLGKIGFDISTCKNTICHHNDIDVTDMSPEACGIYVIGGHAPGYTVSDIIVSNNYVHGNRQCIMFSNEDADTYIRDITIANNVIVTTGGYESLHQFNMNMPNYYDNIKIIHNTIYTTGSDGNCIQLEASSSVMTNVVIANNILWSVSGRQFSSAAPVTLANNLNWGASGYMAGTLRGDPLFTNIGTGAERFHIQSGSPVINAGSSLYGTQYDFDGKARTSAYDIGAYEYDGTTSPPTPASPAPTLPVISQVNIIHSSTDLIVAGYGWENFTCVVTDNDGESTVLLLLKNPDKSTTNVPMIKKTDTTTYYANQSLHQTGEYSYHIQVTDINNNVVLSSSHTFWLQPNWDIDNDGICNIRDLVLISNHYGEKGFKGWIREDVDHNGVIRGLDIAIVSSHIDRSWWS
jgi:hypothetical protein